MDLGALQACMRAWRTQFVNGIISQLLCLLQTDHELSLAYSKEQNAIVERANKEVMRHLTAIISIG